MKLSVIVPVYNAAKYIGCCLGDLLMQTIWENNEDNMEIIVVNDASTDESDEIIEKISAQNPKKIKHIVLNENHGPGGARNYGMQEATGDYIGFMDSDDRIDCHMYEKLLDMAEKSGNPDFVDCGIWNEAEKSTGCYSAVVPTGVLDDEKRSRLLLSVGYIWSRIYRRDFLVKGKILFRENAVMEDQDFLSEVIAKTIRMAVIPEVLYIYLDIQGSASKKNAEVEFFHSTIETIQATYNKLSKLGNYHGIQKAVEYNFWQLYLMNLQTIETYLQNEIIDENVAFGMIEILNKLMDRVVSGTVENNEFVLARMDEKSIDEIKKFII